MAKYDVLYLDDDPSAREITEGILGEKSLTFQSCGALNELPELLNNNEFSVYLLDGRFPEEKGDVIEMNFPKAAKMIKEKDPNARVVLYSGEMFAEELAEEHGALCFTKGIYDSKEIVAELEKIIKSE